MSNDVDLYSFPTSDTEALAILYTKNQDLKGKSVKEIAEIYYNAYYELRNSKSEIRKKAMENFPTHV